jgi:hypothetical protein
MRILNLAITIIMGTITTISVGQASPLDEHHGKNRVLVVFAPAGDAAADTQRRITKPPRRACPSDKSF